MILRAKRRHLSGLSRRPEGEIYRHHRQARSLGHLRCCESVDERHVSDVATVIFSRNAGEFRSRFMFRRDARIGKSASLGEVMRREIFSATSPD